MVKIQVRYYNDDSKVGIKPDYVSDIFKFNKLEDIDIYFLLQCGLGDMSKNIFKDLDSKTIVLGSRFVVMEDGKIDEYNYKDFYELIRMDKTMKITLNNIEGLYIGDICYALEDSVYDGVWGKNDYEPGRYETEDGLQFAVDNTYGGDGFFQADDGTDYAVDAGVIGVVDLRLATKYNIEQLGNLGKVIMNVDSVQFESDNGLFDITVYKDGNVVYTTEINTRDIEEDDDDFWYEED